MRPMMTPARAVPPAVYRLSAEVGTAQADPKGSPQAAGTTDTRARRRLVAGCVAVVCWRRLWLQPGRQKMGWWPWAVPVQGAWPGGGLRAGASRPVPGPPGGLHADLDALMAASP